MLPKGERPKRQLREAGAAQTSPHVGALLETRAGSCSLPMVKVLPLSFALFVSAFFCAGPVKICSACLPCTRAVHTRSALLVFLAQGLLGSSEYKANLNFDGAQMEGREYCRGRVLAHRGKSWENMRFRRVAQGCSCSLYFDGCFRLFALFSGTVRMRIGVQRSAETC